MFDTGIHEAAKLPVAGFQVLKRGLNNRSCPSSFAANPASIEWILVLVYRVLPAILSTHVHDSGRTLRAPICKCHAATAEFLFMKYVYIMHLAHSPIIRYLLFRYD